MNKESKHVLPLLAGKSNLDEVSVEELQQLADAYPYFSAAQLLLLQKKKAANEAGLQEQLLKTALYFPNEQWLRYFLSDDKGETIKTVAGTIPLVVETNDDLLSDRVSNTEAEEEKIIHSERIKESEAEEDANLVTLPAEQLLEDISDKESIQSEPEEIPLDEDELKQQSEPLPIDEANQKIASLLFEQAEEFNKPVEEKTEVPISTEPFHSVDYFASQGIKLDAKPNDTVFDKKVHKFTDWLRQMKRINPHPVDLGTETEEETVVAGIADSSNYTKAIVTESMADVLLKQGKREKAVEIYQKLSLLNPDKSTYFAALIQKIK